MKTNTQGTHADEGRSPDVGTGVGLGVRLYERIQSNVIPTGKTPGEIVEVMDRYLDSILPVVYRNEIADSARLCWLEDNNGRLQYEADDEESLPYAVVYLPTLENGESR